MISRRAMIAAAASVPLMACHGALAALPREMIPPDKRKTPDEALELLREGNRGYAAGDAAERDKSERRRLALLPSQSPFAALVCCSDSRVPPELLFGRGLGELFVIRNAGNTVDTVAMGSIEYAVAVLRVPLIVVLGHQFWRCGGCRAVGGPEGDQLSRIDRPDDRADHPRRAPGTAGRRNESARSIDKAQCVADRKRASSCVGADADDADRRKDPAHRRRHLQLSKRARSTSSTWPGHSRSSSRSHLACCPGGAGAPIRALHHLGGDSARVGLIWSGCSLVHARKAALISGVQRWSIWPGVKRCSRSIWRPKASRIAIYSAPFTTFSLHDRGNRHHALAFGQDQVARQHRRAAECPIRAVDAEHLH